MAKVHIPLDTFSEVDPVSTVVPTFEGDSFPVTYSFVQGEGAIHNSNYTINSAGEIRVIVIPTTPEVNVIRYQVAAEHDTCMTTENLIIISYTATSYAPQVNRYLGPDLESYGLDSEDTLVANIVNIPTIPNDFEITLSASWENDDPQYVSSLFKIDPDGGIRVNDFYAIRELSQYKYTVIATDPNNNISYSTNICLGPFIFESTPKILTEDASNCQSITIDTTEASFSCEELALRFPSGLNPAELEFYNSFCDSEIVGPVYAHHYEPLTTSFLEARSYTINMSGLDSQIIHPQTMEFAQGEDFIERNLDGDVSKITLFRSAGVLQVQFNMDNTNDVISINLNDNTLLDHPLLTTFTEDVIGYESAFVYSVTSNQVFKFSQTHGDYIRHENACFMHLGVVIGSLPDIYGTPDGGAFLNESECLGG